MSENSLVTIRNGVVTTVIGGVILLTIPVLRSYVVNFLNWVWSGLNWSWEALFASYSLPGWSWLLIFTFSIIGAANVFLMIKGERDEPEFKKYIEDSIRGAKWRWNWSGTNITNIWCYCPHCDATLVYDDSSCRSFHTNINKTDFICENCNHNIISSITGGNKDYATGLITREIERRVRTGEYQKH